MTEAAMKAYFDGWFFAIDFERGRTVSTEVPRDFIPDHKPKYTMDDEDKPNNNAHRWTVNEDATLLEMRRAGNTFRQIGAAVGLSGSSCQCRYHVLRTALGLKAEPRHTKPLKFSLEVEARIAELRERGMGFDEIGPLVGLTRQTANEIYRRYRRRKERMEAAA